MDYKQRCIIYHNLIDEQAQKQAEVDLLNNCLADILGEL